MSKPARFWSCLYNTEASWGDSATTTFGTRLQLLQPPDLSGLVRESLPVGQSQQYAEEGIANVSGPYGGEFTIVLGLSGHGGATTGALTETALSTLLGNFFGVSQATQVGDTLLSGTSATQFADNGSLVTASGAMLRVGVAGDTRGNGQYTVINAPATTTTLVALDGTPNAGDQLYVSQMVFPDERPGSLGTVSSTRFKFQSANNQWHLWGCFPKSASISGLNHGEIPQISLTYGVSYWEDGKSATFPDTTSPGDKDLAPVTFGSVFVQDVGTTTRQKFSLRNWSLNINQEVQPIMGPGSSNDGSIIVGACRTRCSASFSMQFPAEAAGTTTWSSLWDAKTLQHILVTVGTGAAAQDGKMLGFYFPNCRMVGNRPTQSDGDGINRVDTEWEAMTSTDTSTNLTLSSWRLAMG